MKIPRDLNATELIRVLKVFGYSVVRQTGSHIRLSSMYAGEEHFITVPNHDPIKNGTVNGILGDVAQYLSISKQDLVVSPLQLTQKGPPLADGPFLEPRTIYLEPGVSLAASGPRPA